MPQIKDTINATKKDLNNILKQLNSHKKVLNVKYLKKKQGEIYNFISLSNRINIELIMGFILFVFAILMLFIAGEYYIVN